MKEQIIELIKKYRAESDRLWNPTSGYPSEYDRAHSYAYDHCADDLEEILKGSQS